MDSKINIFVTASTMFLSMIAWSHENQRICTPLDYNSDIADSRGDIQIKMLKMRLRVGYLDGKRMIMKESHVCLGIAQYREPNI